MQCHTSPDRVILLHSYTGNTGIHIQQHAAAYRDLQRLTKADRDSQSHAGSCLEMHRQLGRQRERQRERDRDRQKQTERERGRARQKQTEKGRDRQRQAETDRDRQRQRYIQRYIHGETDICREWACRGKELYTCSAIQAQIESYCCRVTQERQA